MATQHIHKYQFVYAYLSKSPYPCTLSFFMVRTTMPSSSTEIMHKRYTAIPNTFKSNWSLYLHMYPETNSLIKRTNTSQIQKYVDVEEINLCIGTYVNNHENKVHAQCTVF